jgi:hypothetical protein
VQELVVNGWKGLRDSDSGLKDFTSFAAIESGVNHAGECMEELLGVEAVVSVEIESSENLSDRFRELLSECEFS